MGGHETINIPLAMLLIFGSAKLLAELFERLGAPGIVGEIVAGVLLGPSVLGWVQPNDLIRSLADLGVLFLLFRVGLEVKASSILRVGGSALIVAVMGVVLPFFGGWGLMAFWHAPRLEGIFVGAALVATSVGITAQVLGAKGLLHHTASQIILGAAVIDDILGLLVMAVVSSMAAGQMNWLSLGTTAFLATFFTVIVAFWGSHFLKRVVPMVESRLSVGESQFNVALVVLFGLAVLANYVGVAAIIGAFLAGMALAETVNERVHDLAHGITELLVPFFLANIGLQLDLKTLAEPSTLLLGTLLVIIAVISKMIGCGLGAWRMSWPDRFRIGSGMIPRGEVGMVVAQLGLSLGVIPKPVYAVVVLMAVATTIIAPPLLKIAYRDVQPAAPEEVFELG